MTPGCCCSRHSKVRGRRSSQVNRSCQVPCWGLFQPVASDGPGLFAPLPFSPDGHEPGEAQDAFLSSGGASCTDPVTLWLSQTLHHKPRDLGYLGKLTDASMCACTRAHTHPPTHTHPLVSSCQWEISRPDHVTLLCVPGWQMALGIPRAVLIACLYP